MPSFRVAWSAEDDEYVATCDQYPLLSWIDRDPVDALDNLVSLIEETEADLQ